MFASHLNSINLDYTVIITIGLLVLDTLIILFTMQAALRILSKMNEVQNDGGESLRGSYLEFDFMGDDGINRE